MGCSNPHPHSQVWSQSQIQGARGDVWQGGRTQMTGLHPGDRMTKRNNYFGCLFVFVGFIAFAAAIIAFAAAIVILWNPTMPEPGPTHTPSRAPTNTLIPTSAASPTRVTTPTIAYRPVTWIELVSFIEDDHTN